MGDYNRMSYNQSNTVSRDEMKYIESFINNRIKSRTGREILYLSYGPPKERRRDGPRNIICHLCRVDNMTTAADLKHHLNGDMHQANLNGEVVGRAVYKPYQYVYEYENGEPVFFLIRPGENVPFFTSRWEQRFENPIKKPFKGKRMPMMRLRRDSAIHFDYKYPLLGLDYLILTDNREVFCFLCDGFFATNVYEHASNIDHERKYIIQHFPKLLEKAKSLLRIPDSSTRQRLIHHVFRQLYGQIAKKRGRKRIYAVPHEDLVKNMQAYKDHALIRLTPYDENTLYYDKTAKKFPSLVKECRKDVDNVGFYPPHIPDLVGGGLTFEAERRIFWKQMTKIVGVYKLKTPKRESYEKAKEKELTALKSKYKKYDDLPESHPDYSNVWKAYYIQTCEMLKKDGIRIADHDFERDWFPHWDRYKENAFQKELDSIKANLKKTFNIRVSSDQEDSTSECTSGPDLSDIEDEDDDLNWVPDREITETNKPADLLGVLRILSALENYLGSLGPKCMELLGEAIIKEKNNQLDEILIDDTNLIYFATVNEKLKGLLVTQSIASEVVHKVELLVEDINNLIRMMESYKDMNEHEKFNFGNKSNELSAPNNYQMNSMDSIVQESNIIEPNAFRDNSRLLNNSDRQCRAPSPQQLPPLNYHQNFQIGASNNGRQQDYHPSVGSSSRGYFGSKNFDDTGALSDISEDWNQNFPQYDNYDRNNRRSTTERSNWRDPTPENQIYSASSHFDTKGGAKAETQIYEPSDFGPKRESSTINNGRYRSYEGGTSDSELRREYADDRFRGNIVQNDASGDWTRNRPQFDDDRNHRRSAPERNDWMDPRAEHERYPESSNFEPRRDFNTSRHDSDARYRDHGRGNIDAEFRRERPDYQRSREPSRREDRDNREHRYERNRPMESKPRSRSRSRGYNNDSGRSRNYGYSRESRRY